MGDAMAPLRPSSKLFPGNSSFSDVESRGRCILAMRWREHGDGSAAHQLLTSHLRLVAKIAMAYRRVRPAYLRFDFRRQYWALQAIKRFDPDRGVKFATYAIWWIKAAIKEYIMRSWSLVKMGTTANQKKLFFNLPKAKRRLFRRSRMAICALIR